MSTPATTSTTPLRQRPAWAALTKHHETIRGRELHELFAEDPARGERLTAEGAGLYLDYSKNLVIDETLALLVQLAEQSRLAERIEAMFAGERINVSEDRAVLHVALRMPRHASLIVAGVDVVAEVHAVLDRMATFAERVRAGAWLGYTGKPIRNIVNIGIGGSDLGPVMAYEALRHYSRRELTFRFVSNVDATDFVEATRDLDPQETLFIVSSKTFTTLETMTNANSARAWSLAALGAPEAIAKHFVAVSTNAAEVERFGIDTANMFGFWDWVGGRYSMDSAIGLSTMLAIGPDRFAELLAGFHAINEHFRGTPSRATCPCCWVCSQSGTAISSGRRPSGDALRAISEALPGVPAAAYDGVQRQARHARRSRGRLRNRRGLLAGEPGTNGQHSFLPADPPGHEADPGRPDRLREVAEPTRSAPRHPDVKRLRAGRGARVRQDRARGARGGHTRGTRRTPRNARQPTDEHDPRRAADAVLARNARSRSTSTASSRRARSGISTPSTSGVSSSARRSRSASSPSSTATASRDSRTTAPPTR